MAAYGSPWVRAPQRTARPPGRGAYIGRATVMMNTHTHTLTHTHIHTHTHATDAHYHGRHWGLYIYTRVTAVMHTHTRALSCVTAVEVGGKESAAYTGADEHTRIIICYGVDG